MSFDEMATKLETHKNWAATESRLTFLLIFVSHFVNFLSGSFVVIFMPLGTFHSRYLSIFLAYLLVPGDF